MTSLDWRTAFFPTALVALAALLGACGSTAAPTSSPAAPPAAAPVSSPAAAGSASAAASAGSASAAKPAAAQSPAANAKAATPFKFLFGYRIQANPSTAAVVIGKDQGYYAQQGINMDWDVVTGQTSLRLIATGQYQAGSVGGPGTVVDMVSQNLPLIAVAIINQEGSRTFAVKADSPIKTPKDFEGMKAGIKIAPWPEYECMLKQNNVDRSKIKEISIGQSNLELKQGIVDILPTFKSNPEPSAYGVDVRTINPEANGCATWGTTLVINKQFAADHPDVVTGWLKATLKALQFYSDNKQQALDIVQKYSGVDVTPSNNAFIYSIEQPQLLTDVTRTNGLGWMTRGQWDTQMNQMYSQGLVKTRPKTDDMMTLDYLQKIYKDGKLIWP